MKDAAKNVTKQIIKKKMMAIALGALSSIAPFFLFLIPTIVVIFIVLGIFTTDISANTGSKAEECGFTISRTSLSKTEYKNKLEEFAKTNHIFQIFADNANGIYEYSQSKGINPELVPIRAYVEGAGKTTGNNNYWGMNCTNTGGINACYDYETFEEGYQDFVNNISQYDSLVSMMSNYAYIGAQWYNPGGSDVGGCYYASYIYDPIPVRVKEACATDAPKCSILNTSNCTTTTAEDQEAYSRYQIKTMSLVRYNIFELEEDDGPCSSTDNVETGNTITSQPNFKSDAWQEKNPYSCMGQCTWFAWGRFYEIYGYDPGFRGNGYNCASELVVAHGDKFKLEKKPKAGAVFSSDNVGHNHVGIVVDVDGENITIQEGNLAGEFGDVYSCDSFGFAKTDWHETTYTLQQLRELYGDVVFANPK